MSRIDIENAGAIIVSKIVKFNVSLMSQRRNNNYQIVGVREGHRDVNMTNI